MVTSSFASKLGLARATSAVPAAKHWAPPPLALRATLVFLLLLDQVAVSLVLSPHRWLCNPSPSRARWAHTHYSSGLLRLRDYSRDTCISMPQRPSLYASNHFIRRPDAVSRLRAGGSVQRRPATPLEGLDPQVSAALSGLRDPVDTVEGIGPRRRECLERGLGIYSLADALVNLPEKFSDKSIVSNLLTCASGDEVTLEVRVDGMRAGHGAGRPSPSTLRCVELTSGMPVDIVFFMGRFSYRHFQMLSRSIQPGSNLLVHGRITIPSASAPASDQTVHRAGSNGPSVPSVQKQSKFKPDYKVPRAQIINPELYVESTPENRAKYLTAGPVYRIPSASGLSSEAVRSVAAAAVRLVETLQTASQSEDWMSPAQRLKHGWPSLSQAFKGVHIFDSSINISLIEAARERVAFEELFVRQSVLLRNRALSVSNESHEIPQKNKTVVDCVRKNIRFAPTRCQEAAVVSIEQDLASPLRMVRLLQGDVGSGKTVVSALAAAYTVASGRQCGYLAPTEMLAKQHFERLVEYFRDVYINGSSSSSPCRPVRVDLITGAVRGKVREQLLHRMRCGDVDVLVGTHALLSEEVLSSFPRLGLAVIDEEQRFGVAQRESIADRVNVLYTTATPIPRSLMMTLDDVVKVSSIASLPPNKRPINTILRPRSEVRALISELRPLVEQRGSKAFWVTPAIRTAAVAEHAGTSLEERRVLLLQAFPGLVGAVHGKMDVAERQRVLEDFRAGRVRILVATSVIEVGIDVPDASICVIDRPERFGLSQLHQIRGRIGRGPGPSGENMSHCMCVLLHSLSSDDKDVVASASADVARARLDALTRSSDGFEIAERDLLIRGPGDSLGLRQAGAIRFKVADVTKDSHLLAEARQTAKAIHNKTYFDSPSVAAAARPWLDLSEELFCTAHRPSVENEEEEEVDEDITAEAARASDKFIRSDEDSLSNVKSSGYSTLRKMDSSCVVDLHDTSSYACVVVDLETSGFSPSRDRIIQLGAALLPPSPPSAGSSFHSRQHYAEVKPESAFFGIHPPVAANIGKAPTPAENPLVESVDKIETFDAYIRPDEYFWLSPAVTEMTGISKEMLRRDGVPFTAAWDLFSDWLRQFSSGRPVVILAHNGKNFDFKFLHAELVRYNRLEDLKRLRIASFVDTLTVLRDKSLWRSDGASSLPAPSSLSLPELHRTLCGQVLRDAHDASADSAAVARILGHSALRDKWRIVANRTQYSSLV